MAKRIKKKTNARSSLKLESLEQRQLLATITGDGVSLDAWQDLSNNGNTYDQILMTGSSVTVQADAGQWARTSFVDLSGDIVQVDFKGAGSLTISLSNFSGPAEAANYNQPGVEYVSGLASFTIQGADANTHFAIYSVGKGVNQGVIAEGKEGGNHWADVQRLAIVADPSNPNGSTFGSIRMGNAVFGGSEGAVGIAAANVHVQDTVIIGDIDAKGAATPQLVFGAASQFGSVRVAGGDLLSSNGNAIDNTTSSANQDSYVYDISFTAGAGSDVVVADGEIVEGEITAAAVLNPAVDFKGGIGFITTLDSSTSIDITGKTQAELNALFQGRTFSNDLTITGDLGAGFEIFVEAFRGNVTFEGDILGDITFTDQNESNPASSGFGGSLTILGDVAGTIEAEKFGAVEIDGDFSGDLLSNEIGSGGDAIPGGIGDVTVSGDFSGQIDSDWGVGDVYVGGNLTSAATTIIARGNSALYQGNVGTVTVDGDVNQGGLLIDITGQGTFGDVVIGGAGELTAINIGGIQVADLGAGQVNTGSVTITDTAGETATVTFDGINILSGEGSVGAVSVTGVGLAGGAFTLTGDIAGGSVGAINVSGFSSITLANDIVAADGDVGAVTLTTLAGTADDAASIVVAENISGKNVGALTFNAGATDSSVVIDEDADIGLGESVGAITITGETVTTDADSVLNADVVGDLSITGTTVTLNGSIGTAEDVFGGITISAEDVTIAGSILAETAGDLSVTGENSITLSGAIDVDTLGNVSVTGDATVSGSLVTETVGAVTFTGDTTLAANSTIVAKTAGVITFDGALTAASDADTSNLVLETADAVVVTGDAAITDGGATNIVVTGTVGGLHFQGATALTGLVLDSTDGAIDGSGSAEGTALLFTDLVANGGNLQTASVGNVVFNGNTDLGAGGFLVADDGEATLDTIGDITFNGTVASADDVLDIRASSIGDINLSMALNLTDKVAVSNLNVFAGQNAKEAVSKDGSNLGSYTIGDINVADTQTKGFAGLSLFAGANSFDALGAVGNVTLTGGGTENQQTALLAANTDTLRVTAGVYAVPGTLISTSGIDFDANGTVGTVVDGDDVDLLPDVDADETAANFSAGEVSIGNVTIHARAVDAGGGDVDNVLNATGLTVAAGVGTALDETATAVDAELDGTIGNILVSNNSQVLTAGTAATIDAVTTPGYFVAATGVGTIQTLDTFDLDAVNVVIGDQDTGADTEADGDEFVVIVV